MGIKNQNVKKTHPLSIWIHAVSVGETKAVAKLAKQIKEHFQSECQLIISSATETGHAEALRSLPFAEHHIYLPFDFPLCIYPLVKKISPDLVILCESEFWYNFLRYSKKQGASIVLVNGKLSERSKVRFKWFPLFTKTLFQWIDSLCIQNKTYLQRFQEIGVNPEKISVTGNLKFDEDYPSLTLDQIQTQKEHLGIAEDDLVICAGSTHQTEELLILQSVKPLWEKWKIKLFLVPRHPERFNEVAQLLETEGIPYVRWTRLSERTGNEKVILVDAMGVLRTCYQIGNIAIVGGSFVEHVGGHNILEPCWYGKPVLYGPHMHTQPELVTLMKEYNAGTQVEAEALTTTLSLWIENAKERALIGANGELLMRSVKGSLNRTFSALEPVLKRLRKKIAKK